MKTFLLVCLLALLPLIGFSHNGKVSYAYPLNNIRIDGNLSDWPSYMIRYNIGRFSGPESKSDFNGFFMIGYNVAEGALYIAFEIMDDSNVAGNAEGNVWGRRQDRHLLYIDPEHSAEKGSGVILLFGSQTGIDTWKADNGWDPDNRSMTKDHVELAVQRTGSRTIYEWKIRLGGSIKPYRSLGIDHEIQDADHDEPEIKTYQWGPGGLKNRVPSRLGDVVLSDPVTPLVNVQGTIAWDESSHEFLPSKVRITSRDKEEFWILAETDEKGRYSTVLPVGKYRVQPAFKTTNALEFLDKKRINEHEVADLSVTEQDLITADTLKIHLYDRPDFIIPGEGLLFHYEEKDARRVDEFMEVYMNYYNVPGAQLALIKDGKVIYNKGFGTRNTITGEPVTIHTIFETASISKCLFAFAVLRLAEEGVLDLDTPLFDYLTFDNIAGDERSRLITARHVLSHQTGLPNWAWGGPFRWKSGGEIRLAFTPGEGYGYSGEAYEYLKRVVEKITGKNIEIVMEEEVFRVMNMDETALSQTDKVTERVALGHVADLPMFWNIETSSWVAGSMYSTTADLGKYMTGLINRVGLSEDYYVELFSPEVENKQAELQFFGGGKVYHSLGFEIQDSPYGRFIHHGGNNGDFQGRFAMLPDQKLGFIVLANNNAGLQLDLALQKFLITGMQSL